MRRELTGAELARLAKPTGHIGMTLTCEGDQGLGPCGNPLDWTDGTCANGHTIERIVDDEPPVISQEITTIRARLDGQLESVHGPICCAHVSVESILQTMGWNEHARGIALNTLALMREGKAVLLTSGLGWSKFQPLADDEDGLLIPASAATVYNSAGVLIERTLKKGVL